MDGGPVEVVDNSTLLRIFQIERTQHQNVLIASVTVQCFTRPLQRAFKVDTQANTLVLKSYIISRAATIAQ